MELGILIRGRLSRLRIESLFSFSSIRGRCNSALSAIEAGAAPAGKGGVTSQVLTRRSEAVDSGLAECDTRSSGETVVRRQGGVVWCPNRKDEAVVSVIERTGPEGEVRYVQWCSRIGLDDCGQECICQTAEPVEG